MSGSRGDSKKTDSKGDAENMKQLYKEYEQYFKAKGVAKLFLGLAPEPTRPEGLSPELEKKIEQYIKKINEKDVAKVFLGQADEEEHLKGKTVEQKADASGKGTQNVDQYLEAEKARVAINKAGEALGFTAPLPGGRSRNVNTAEQPTRERGSAATKQPEQADVKSDAPKEKEQEQQQSNEESNKPSGFRP